MRAPRLLVIAMLLAAPVVAGCGSAGVTTGTVADGTTVEARQYLADAGAATAALRDFSAVLDTLPRPATAAALRGVAGRLEAPLAAATAVSVRLAAERLQDQRLDAQRIRTSAAFSAVVTAMGRVRDAAAAGDPAAAVTASTALSEAVGALRASVPGR